VDRLRVRLPAIVLLLGVGILIGPVRICSIRRDVRELLFPLTSLSVAIISSRAA
jgi:hypothetical protein